MNVFDYIEKELDRIEVGYTSYDGTKITLTMDEVRELVQNLRKKYKSDGDVIYRHDAIMQAKNIRYDADIRADKAIDDVIYALEQLPSAQPELSGKVERILDFLDTELHPIVSPEHWDVYSELHDMVSMLSEPSAQPNRSLLFRIGEICVDESKGDITAEVAIEKIRALLRAER